LNVSVEVKKEPGDISLGGRNPAFSLFLSFFAFLTNQLRGGRERAWLAGWRTDTAGFETRVVL
jgi:hypothetical protein